VLFMGLSRFPRRKYTNYQTPLEKLEHVSKKLNGPNIYIKRDDLLGLTAGGNKTRKLEFLVADAIQKGADTLITIGGVQSNHCRLTLAAAVKEQMKCILFKIRLTLVSLLKKMLARRHNLSGDHWSSNMERVYQSKTHRMDQIQ
jgi:1-aminocyclopropane-1-carboxylate deaminase/D-cysteine desulfhydrase-like pyridoxal-dependent ACC family enzyme